jgi:hypothetical protein
VWDLTLAASVSPEATAAIGLVTAVVSAAAGHWFGALREQRNMGWQARDAWLREIRGVLDDAARAVAEAGYAFDRRRTATDADRDELGAKAYLRLMEAEVAGQPDLDAAWHEQRGVQVLAGGIAGPAPALGASL